MADGAFTGAELAKDKDTREPLSFDKVEAILGDLLSEGDTRVLCGRHHNVVR